MRRVTKYFAIGLILQLLVLCNIVYWFVLVSSLEVETAIERYAANFPEFLRDATVIMIIVAALTTISMMCYGAARKLSLKKSFRNLCMGLILLDAIVLLWIVLSLM